MRVYLAAPWVRRREARAVAEIMESYGFELTSRWMHVHGDSTDPVVLAQEAQNDLDDIDASDVLVLLNLEKSEGKAVETGYALMLDMPIIVIGARSNVFHYLPQITVVQNVIQAVNVLQGKAA